MFCVGTDFLLAFLVFSIEHHAIVLLEWLQHFFIFYWRTFSIKLTNLLLSVMQCNAIKTANQTKWKDNKVLYVNPNTCARTHTYIPAPNWNRTFNKNNKSTAHEESHNFQSNVRFNRNMIANGKMEWKKNWFIASIHLECTFYCCCCFFLMTNILILKIHFN